MRSDFLPGLRHRELGLPDFLSKSARALLGDFRSCYLLFIILILAVFGAAAGAIGAALFGWPPLVGTFCLIACISLVAAYGTASVERLFKWVSIFLYGVYAIFVVLSFFAFGDQIVANLAAPAPHDGWVLGGLPMRATMSWAP